MSAYSMKLPPREGAGRDLKGICEKGELQTYDNVAWRANRDARGAFHPDSTGKIYQPRPAGKLVNAGSNSG